MRFLFCLLLLAVAVRCTTQRNATVKLPPVVTQPTPQLEMPVATDIMGPRKTPTYALPADASLSFKEAVGYVEKYGNADAFFTFVAQKNITKFAHENLPVNEAITKFRNCLDQAGTIPVVWKRSIYPSVIGAYSPDGNIYENPAKILTAVERARHLYHETSHKCGFKHLGNSWNKNDNLNSFPYVMGYAFEDFVEAQEKSKLAGAQ